MKKVRNILYIGGFELPDKNAAAQRVVANGKIFNSLGYNVIFIGVDKSKESDMSLIQSCTVGDFSFLSRPQIYPKSKLDWLKFITDITFLKQIVEHDLDGNVDIIVAYNYPAITLKKLISYGKKKNIKIVADVTEWYGAEGGILFRIIKSADSYLRMNIFQKHLDGLIVISRYLYNFYKQNNALLVPPLVDKSDKKWINSDYKLDNSIIRLIYIGSPGNGQKDRLDIIINILLKIQDKVRPFKFTIIGISEEEYINQYGEESLANNIKKSILFKGKKPHLEAIEELKKSHFSIFIRNKNLVNNAGFPTKFVESITSGTPVITNATSNISDYLEDGRLGRLIDPINLEESLIKVLNVGQDEILEMKENCKNFNQFDYSFYVEAVKKFLERI